MNDVTQILSRIEAGDPSASEQLLPLVYDELRRLAAQRLSQEQPGQTLQATALVHEAYLRLVDGNEAGHWNGRGHFFGAAAEAMRRILVNRARDKNRLKRGGQRRRIHLDSAITIRWSNNSRVSVTLSQSSSSNWARFFCNSARSFSKADLKLRRKSSARIVITRVPRSPEPTESRVPSSA
jgi:RNA polymerase sigma factor (TIGR02999 family)